MISRLRLVGSALGQWARYGIGGEGLEHSIHLIRLGML